MSSPRPGFDVADVEVVSDDIVFQGFFRMNKLRLRHRLFAGGWTPVFSRELFIRGDAVCILPYDPESDQVVLTEQFRVGAVGHEGSPWLFELVAGMIEPGESPEDVAHREGEEEAGLQFVRMEPICQYLVSPGGTNEKIHLYVGQVSSVGAAGIHGLPEENEDIRVHVVSAQTAFRMVGDGTINNAAAIIALQWLALNHATLRERWRARGGS